MLPSQPKTTSRRRSSLLPGETDLRAPRGAESRNQDSYLVDPASSHMLVSKIKPCMSKYKQSIQ